MVKDTLIIIPARGGSKRLPSKNIKSLAGKPLIYYTIDVAREVVEDVDICVSSDSEEILSVVRDYELNVPFKRPAKLATDTATTNDVLLHALDFYETKGFSYDKIILLQPTSPLRQIEHILESISLYREEIDMVVSVRESHAATSICQEDKNGYINLIFNTKAGRSQELKNFYEYNGSIYVINTHSLKNKGMSAFTKKVKYVMPSIYSIDIDNQIDWDIAEFLINKLGNKCTINV